MRCQRSVFAVLGRGVTIVALAALAAGCDSTAGRDFAQSNRGVLAILIGPQNEPQQVQVDPNAPPVPRPVSCPPVLVREGTETLRVYARGQEGSEQGVAYQGSMVKTARECAFPGGSTVAMKYGVTGRLVLGPQGTPGNYTLPIRSALIAPTGEPVWTHLAQVPVTVLPGESNATFVYVEEDLVHEVPQGLYINDYIVYVGFDDLAAGR